MSFSHDDVLAARESLLAEGLFPKEDVEEAARRVLARLDASPVVQRAVGSGRKPASKRILTAHQRKRARDGRARARVGDRREARVKALEHPRRPLPVHKTSRKRGER